MSGGARSRQPSPSALSVASDASDVATAAVDAAVAGESGTISPEAKSHESAPKVTAARRRGRSAERSRLRAPSREGDSIALDSEQAQPLLRRGSLQQQVPPSRTGSSLAQPASKTPTADDQDDVLELRATIDDLRVQLARAQASGGTDEVQSTLLWQERFVQLQNDYRALLDEVERVRATNASLQGEVRATQSANATLSRQLYSTLELVNGHGDRVHRCARVRCRPTARFAHCGAALSAMR